MGCINQSNILIVGVQEEKRERKEQRVSEEMMVKNFPNLMKYMNISI